MLKLSASLALVVCLSLPALYGQSATLYRAPRVAFPATIVDGNSPGFWDEGVFRVYTSHGIPVSMAGPGVQSLSMDAGPQVFSTEHFPMWIESVWRDDDGLVYAWYHHEPEDLCADSHTTPKIGALVSSDGGRSFYDLGIVLESSEALRCDAFNNFFAGGHGDLSVILDRERKFFYFLFTNYGGPLEAQGIVAARMAFEDRASPVGAVWKLHRGLWEEPGLGGSVTAIYPAQVAWESKGANSYWGPAVHWNTAIERFVILMNHACCDANWSQEGIYIAYTPDLADLSKWTRPVRLLAKAQIEGLDFYPQIFGLGAGESDTLAGQLPRLFIQGVSNWTVFFEAASPTDPEDTSGHASSIPIPFAARPALD